MAALLRRAVEYWDARLKRDDCQKWNWLKGLVPCDEHERRKRAIEYIGYEVGDARIEGSFATVQVKVTARITLPGSQAKPVVKTATVPDAWIKVEGAWYRRADQSSARPERGLGGQPDSSAPQSETLAPSARVW
jgi:hypothetical protein